MDGGASLQDTNPAEAAASRVGIGLKSQHLAELLERRPALSFLEIHAENYMGAGGPPHRWLSAVAEHYPLSVHGVGLSVGGDQDLDREHLDQLARVVERYQPFLVSEHLAWSRYGEIFLNDLLPIRYDEAALMRVADHVDQIQSRLGRQILVENPASYVAFAGSTLEEPQFLAELVRRSGCGLLLDVNNIYVSHVNVGLPIAGYLQALPQHAIGEIHLAGHHVRPIDGQTMLIDDHGAPICDAVWQIYRDAIRILGPTPSLIERDSNIPPLEALLVEAAHAGSLQREESHAALS